MDNAKQVVSTKTSWERSRNQQRNWETIIQLISMITQPTILQQPVCHKDQDLNDYNFNYDGKHTVWEFTIGAEQTGVFGVQESAERLVEMCNKIPFITGLNETIIMDRPVLLTQDTVNLYFEKIQF